LTELDRNAAAGEGVSDAWLHIVIAVIRAEAPWTRGATTIAGKVGSTKPVSPARPFMNFVASNLRGEAGSAETNFIENFIEAGIS
jgi:hypothetical protein